MEAKLSTQQQQDYLLQLVEGMEGALISVEDSIRSAAVDRIVQALEEHTTHYSASSINHVAGFFAEKLTDRACLGGALRACEILLCKPQGEASRETKRGSQAELVDQSIVEKVERTIATDLPVPTLSHENRRLCLSVLRGIVGQDYGRQLLQSDVPLLGHVMEVVDSERDPRCLLVAFDLLRAVIMLYCTSDNASRAHLEAKADDVCDVVSCYFPITFRLPPNSEHGVTRERLAAELEATMTCTPTFAPHLIPLLMDKLSSSIPQAKLDAISALTACINAWGSSPFNSSMGRIWWLLREETSSPDEQAASAAATCLRTFMRAEQESSRGDEGFKSLLNQVLEDEMVLDLPQWLAESSAGGQSAALTKRFSSINPLLTAVAGATPAACSALVRRILNPLCSHINAGQPEAEVLALSSLLALFRGAAEGCASWPRSSDAELAVQKDLSNGGSRLIQALLPPSPPPGGDRCLPLSVTQREESGGLKEGLLPVRLLAQLVSFKEGRAQPLSPQQHGAAAAALLQVVWERHGRPELAHEAAQGLVSMAGANHVAVFKQGVLAGLVEAACDGSRAEAADGVSTPELRCLVDASRLSPGLRPSVLSSMADLSAPTSAVIQASLALLARLSAERDASSTAAAATALLNALAGEVLPGCTSPSGFEGEEAAVATRLVLGLLEASESLRGAVESAVVVAVASAAQSATAGCAVAEQEVIALRAAHRVVGWDASLSASDRKEAALTAACASLIALRPATVLDESKVAHVDLLRSTMDSALLSLSELSAEVAAAATASLLLKWRSGRTSLDVAVAMALDDVIFPHLQLHVREYGATPRVRATQLLGWVGKALAMIKHPALSKPLETATAALEVASLDMAGGEQEGWKEQEGCETSDVEGGAGEGDPEFEGCEEAVDVEEARAMARLFATLLQQGQGLARLNKSVHAVGKLIWQQRVFTEAMTCLNQKLLEGLGYMGFPPTPLLLAVSHLSGACAPEVLRAALEIVLLWLLPALQALTTGPLADGQALRAALQGVRAALDCEPGRRLLEDRVGQVVSGLLADAAFKEDEAVRTEALHCLSLLTQLPYVKLHPHRGDVLAALDKAVDDPKRSIRSQAAATKRVWAQQR